MSALSTLIAVLVGIVLGLAVLVYVRNARRERRLAAEMAMIDAGAASATTAPAETAPLTATSSLDAGMTVVGDLDDDATGGAAAAPSEVTLHLPPGARLYVDGRQLPDGTERVARPDAGFVTVLVKADAHQDALVEITPTSPDEIEVTMVEKPKPKPRHVPPPDPASTIAMPPNPYE